MENKSFDYGGELMQIPIEKIKVRQRARKEFIEIEELAESLNRVGLLNPIIVDQNKVRSRRQTRN